jgi:hypothetical protein
MFTNHAIGYVVEGFHDLRYTLHIKGKVQNMIYMTNMFIELTSALLLF